MTTKAHRGSKADILYAVYDLVKEWASEIYLIVWSYAW